MSAGHLHLDGFGSRTLKKKDHPMGGLPFLEQDTGVEPAFTAWETQKRVLLQVHQSVKNAVFTTVF